MGKWTGEKCFSDLGHTRLWYLNTILIALLLQMRVRLALIARASYHHKLLVLSTELYSSKASRMIPIGPFSPIVPVNNTESSKQSDWAERKQDDKELWGHSCTARGILGRIINTMRPVTVHQRAFVSPIHLPFACTVWVVDSQNSRSWSVNLEQQESKIT